MKRRSRSLGTARHIGLTSVAASRHRRAFTLVETVAALAVSSVVFVALVLWVSSLMRATTTAVELSATTRDGRWVTTRLEEDLRLARSCDPAGFGPILAASTATSLEFFADVVDAAGVPSSDGVVDEVSYTITDGSLVRSVSPGTGTCPSSFASPSFSVTVARNVAPVDVTTPVFVVLVAGAPVPFEASCLVSTYVCRVDAVRFRAEIAAAAPSNARTAVDRTLYVPATSLRL